MRKSLLIGNWKLNGSQHFVANLLQALKIGIYNTGDTQASQMVVLPPTIFIPQVAAHLASSPIEWGGQDMSEYRCGAYTGEVSGEMLMDYGCRYVLLGHSERKKYYGETRARVERKVLLAEALGLIPILCIGETWQQYQSGQAVSVLLQQLDDYFALDPSVFSRMIIAYEPLWAIGAEQSLPYLEIQAIHKKLRAHIAYRIDAQLAQKMRILYGGGVKPDNAKMLFKMPDIDGGLVGSASLSADIFLSIYHSFS